MIKLFRKLLISRTVEYSLTRSVRSTQTVLNNHVRLLTTAATVPARCSRTACRAIFARNVCADVEVCFAASAPASPRHVSPVAVSNLRVRTYRGADVQKFPVLVTNIYYYS